MTCKEAILDYLERRGMTAGGTIEDFVRENYGYKASNVGRRLRDLENEKKIIADHSAGFVQYVYARNEVIKSGQLELLSAPPIPFYKYI